MGFIHFVILILGCCVTINNACSCVKNDDPKELCKQDFVFRGIAVAETLEGDSLFGTRMYTVYVTQGYLIPEGAKDEVVRITLRTKANGSVCGVRFTLDQDTLFVATYRNGEVWTYLCLPNTEWSKLNSEELRILQTQMMFYDFCYGQRRGMLLEDMYLGF